MCMGMSSCLGLSHTPGLPLIWKVSKMFSLGEKAASAFFLSYPSWLLLHVWLKYSGEVCDPDKSFYHQTSGFPECGFHLILLSPPMASLWTGLTFHNFTVSLLCGNYVFPTVAASRWWWSLVWCFWCAVRSGFFQHLMRPDSRPGLSYCVYTHILCTEIAHMA